jgi:thiopurine S-methyltransferase
MDAEYWLKRWREQRTGWHRDAPMPLLAKHWPSLGVPDDTRVLVPFAGKSLDMLWLAEQGYRVRGMEVSPLAIEQFFAENALEPQRSTDGRRYTAGNIEIIRDDIFAIDDGEFANCNAVYDRAAIIAQPALERERYVREVYGNLPPGCRGLMITLEYPQGEMEGPPFAVDEAEIRRLFAAQWDIELLERRDILAEQPGFREQGVSALSTAVYRLKRRGQ